jgi:hypothetical protein
VVPRRQTALHTVRGAALEPVHNRVRYPLLHQRQKQVGFYSAKAAFSCSLNLCFSLILLQDAVAVLSLNAVSQSQQECRFKSRFSIIMLWIRVVDICLA